MAGLSEFSWDMIFIRKAGAAEVPSFKDAVEQELGKLFVPYGSWSVSLKRENSLEIAVVEMKGIGPWETEDDALQYVENKADDRFWKWLQGYQLRLEQKEDAGCCKLGH